MATKLVQMRLEENTIAKAEKLQNILHVNSKADVVRLAIEITAIIAEAINTGSKILIEDGKGGTHRLVVPQLS